LNAHAATNAGAMRPGFPADAHRCLPQYHLHDDFEFVALHFALVDVILP
jgi:hypothetical protein